MEDKVKQLVDDKFLKKPNSLPDYVDFFLSSDYSGKQINSISKEYNLEKDNIYALIFLAFNYDFDISILENRIKTFGLSGISLKRFWLDFIGRFLLPIADYVVEVSPKKIEPSELITKANGSIDKYKIFVEEFFSELEDYNLEQLEKEVEIFKKKFNEKDEQEYVFELLSADIISVLEAESFEASSILNRSLIYLLFNVDNFKDEALKKIFTNKELIGEAKISIDDKEVAPTVSAWLKDFIKKNGSSLFDNLILAQYLNTSENAKDLKAKDKEILGNLIRFYKNIAFFPESMNEIPPQKWQIFPFDATSYWQEIEGSVKNKNHLGLPTESEIFEEEVGSDDDVLSEKDFKPRNYDDSPELRNLRELLASFPPASLERKAINEEIKRFEIDKK